VYVLLLTVPLSGLLLVPSGFREKVAPDPKHHAMKTYRRRKGKFPCILDTGTREVNSEVYTMTTSR
jgi:hypothetical protein